jgi:hypothetical protein
VEVLRFFESAKRLERLELSVAVERLECLELNQLRQRLKRFERSAAVERFERASVLKASRLKPNL